MKRVEERKERRVTPKKQQIKAENVRKQAWPVDNPETKFLVNPKAVEELGWETPINKEEAAKNKEKIRLLHSEYGANKKKKDKGWLNQIDTWLHEGGSRKQKTRKRRKYKKNRTLRKRRRKKKKPSKAKTPKKPSKAKTSKKPKKSTKAKTPKKKRKTN
jgi:hypothetical protein